MHQDPIVKHSARGDADYIVQMRVKNGPLLRAMRRAGYATAADLSRATGVRQTTLGQYLNLKLTPITAKGEWRFCITKVAEALRTMPENLFPAQHMRIALTKSTAEIEMSIEDITAIPGAERAAIEHQTPEVAVINDDLRRALTVSVDHLPERERAVIEALFGLAGPKQDLAEVAARLGVGKQRVRQIEKKALQRLRHPSSQIYQHRRGW